MSGLGEAEEDVFAVAQRSSLVAGIGFGALGPETCTGIKNGRAPVGEAWLFEGTVVKEMALDLR